MLDLFLPRFHNIVTNLLTGKSRSMQSAGALCRSGAYNDRIKVLWEAVVVCDRRFLKHMYLNEYSGYKSPPEESLIGDQEQRAHRLEDWYENVDLSWRAGVETERPDKIDEQTPSTIR
jgi:hypothetical protein